jgi:hypothetical protein
LETAARGQEAHGTGMSSLRAPPPLCSLLPTTIDLNTNVSASIDDALNVFDEMGIKYAFLLLLFLSFQHLVVGF